MIAAYLRELFRVRFFGPVGLVIAAGALGGRADAGAFTLRFAGAMLLLAQFRIWDDTADRSQDALAHPERVLVRTPNPTPVAALGMLLFAINVALTLQRDATLRSLSLLVLLHAALGVHYLRRRGRTLLGDQMLLAKYPAFVCILAGPRLVDAPFAVTIAALLVHAGACAYEAWHDPVSPLGVLFGGRT